MLLKIEVFIIFVMCTTTSISNFIKMAITENVLTHGDFIKKHIKKDLIDISPEDAEIYKVIPGSIFCKKCKFVVSGGEFLS